MFGELRGNPCTRSQFKDTRANVRTVGPDILRFTKPFGSPSMHPLKYFNANTDTHASSAS